MKKLFLLSTILFLLATQVYSQVITFERTDVEGKSADFVTATYSFGIDIYIDSIEHCGNVSFEISHNQAKNVKFSEYYKSDSWITDGGIDKVVTIIDKNSVDVAIDRATIAIEAGTGIPANINSPNNPKIIHLEFVVSPSAIHGEILEFSISKVRATYFKDTIVEWTIPTTYRIQYRIHSYVNVWPGDTNCDGVVDALDNKEIAMHLTEPNNNARAFKRPYASILWQRQSCIAWDSLAATYSDCDGNGVVTTADYAVVYYNYEKPPHQDNCSTTLSPIQGIIESATNSNNEVNTNNKKFYPHLQQNSGIDSELTPNTKEIPINIDLSEIEIVGAAGIININTSPEQKLIGMKPGKFFGNNIDFFYHINKNNNIASFCISTTDKKPEMHDNTILYVYIEDENNDTKAPNITDFIGFDKYANTKQLSQTTTSVEILDEMQNKFYANYLSTGELQLFNLNREANKIKIINFLGNTIGEFSPNNPNMYNIGKLPSGVYFVICSAKQEIFTTKFLVIE